VRELPSGTVTFLFSDMEGSTRLVQELGEGPYERVLQAYIAVQRRAIEGNGGHVVKTEGDGVFASFGRPTDALAAAVQAQREVTTTSWPEGVTLRVRMGIHTGEAISVDDDYVGLAVHVAARIAAAAHGGQVLVSRATVELAPGADVSDLGSHRLKDILDTVQLYQLQHADLRADFPPPRTLTVLPHNLPLLPTTFVGREKLEHEVATLLGSCPLVTLLGPGGVGKTRLALHVASSVLPRFRDGAWFSELGNVREPAAVADVVASALSVQGAASKGPVEGLVEALRSKHLLLVLDNCEHVVGAVAELAARILASCPDVTVLATSREALAVSGERSVTVPPLDVPEENAPPQLLEGSAAVSLFADRARAVRPGFELSEANAAAIVEICRRLDGVPLAIELAAARVRSLSPADIAKRLREPLRLLAEGGGRGRVERHQTLRAAIEWSYGLLTHEERALFERLSVFAGSFTLEAAEAICEGDDAVDPLDVVSLLGSLVDKSMVVVTDDEETFRYSLLTTLRAFAAERLAAGDPEPVRKRFASYYAELAERIASGLWGPDEARWAREIAAEIDNLREAHGWATTTGHASLALRITTALAWHMQLSLRLEIIRWAERTIGMPEAQGEPLLARAYAVAAAGASTRGELDLSRRYFERGYEIVREDDIVTRILLRWAATEYDFYRGELVPPRELDDDIEMAGRSSETTHLKLALMQGKALMLTYAHRFDEAKVLLDALEEQVRHSGNPSSRAWVHYTRGEWLLDRDPDAAIRHLESAVELATPVGNKLLAGVARVSITSLRARHGDPEEALRPFGEIVRDFMRAGNWQHLWTTLRNLVELFARLGELEAATTLLSASEAPDNAPPVYGDHATRLDALARRARDELGDERYAAARSRGQAMSPGDAVAFALASIDGAVARSAER